MTASSYDVLVIGTGIAGVSAALRLAEDKQRRIAVITRAMAPEDSNSNQAQGGVVGRGDDDTAEQLMADIERAGDGLCHRPAVEVIAQHGPRMLDETFSLPEVFATDSTGALAFGLEAAHSRRRVLHAADTTGRAIMRILLQRLARRKNVDVLCGHTAIDLITFPHHARDDRKVYAPRRCLGAYAFVQQTRRVTRIVAPVTVLASGGLGQIFLNTSNPVGARGDGLAMAHRAGARIVNAEFVQFHPTILAVPGAQNFLISEAVRGEGGKLLSAKGEPFMERYAPRWKDLAPRDVVSRAIYWQMLESGASHVLLDIASHLPPTVIKNRFPKIFEVCAAHGLDISKVPIPVVPGAHYSCGGVLVDLWGRSSLPGLYAVGEVSCTGVHGANRLASTSLLEGLVWGTRAAHDIRARDDAPSMAVDDIAPWDDSGLLYEPDPALIRGDLQTVRNIMWHYVGLVRNGHRLDRALRELRHLRHEVEDFYRKTKLSDGLIGLRNAVQAGLIVAQAARQNPVSRGCHFREDARAPAGAGGGAPDSAA